MRRATRAAAMMLTASVMTGMLTGCDSARATVSRVVDGDTIDVTADGREQRVRLLNIDTPETVDPDEDVQCLGPEASAHLASLLPVGTEVELLVDDEHRDGYDRVLAGVRLDDGRLVNAEMARAGLALPMAIGRNDRFLPEVEQANAEAVAAQRGLYDPEIGCTVPGQVADIERTASTLPSSSAATTAEQADSGASGAAAVIASALLLKGALDSGVPGDGLIWKAAHALPTRSSMSARVQRVAGTARTNENGFRERARVLRTPPPPPPAAGGGTGSAASSPRPKPKPKPSGGGAGATAKPTPKPSSGGSAGTPKPAPKPKPNVDTSGGSGPAGYTGPRCYAPGGKTWKPC